MSQIKIYALNETIELHRDNLSKAIHQALVKELKYPEEKRFQRFIALESKDFVYPVDRSKSYIIIEISMFDGSVHDKFHRTLVLSGFFFLKISSTFLNSSFFPKPIKRRIAI